MFARIYIKVNVVGIAAVKEALAVGAGLDGHVAWVDSCMPYGCIGGCVGWVPGMIVDVFVGDLIEALSTWGCGIGLEGLLFGLVVGAILLYVLGGGRFRGTL